MEDFLNKLGQRLVDRLVNDIRTKRVTKYGAVNASGQLADSIRYVVTGESLEIWGLDYVYYVSKGRGKNVNQSPEALKKWVGWAGSTFLKDWVVAKGVNINPFAVAYSVARKGNTVHQQGGSDLLTAIFNDALVEEINAALREELFTQFKSVNFSSLNA